MSNKSYAQLRAELLEKVDVDVNANAKLVSGASHNCKDNETACLVPFTGKWECCPYPNAVCCPGDGITVYCCPDGYKCALFSDEFGIPQWGCEGPNGVRVYTSDI